MEPYQRKALAATLLGVGLNAIRIFDMDPLMKNIIGGCGIALIAVAIGIIIYPLVRRWLYAATFILVGIAIGSVATFWWKSLGPAFSVEVRSAYVNHAGPLTLYMVTYPSMYGLTASSVFYLAFVQVTNHQDVAATINEFEVEVSKEPGGQWENLVPIPLHSVDLYVLGITDPPVPKSITLGHMTAHTDSARPSEDMKYAALLRAGPALEEELSKPIQAHTSVSAWVALDASKRVGLVTEQIYFRVTLHDAAQRGRSYVAPLPIEQFGSPKMSVNNGSLEVTGVRADISAAHVKYYSDPFPSLGSR